MFQSMFTPPPHTHTQIPEIVQRRHPLARPQVCDGSRNCSLLIMSRMPAASPWKTNLNHCYQHFQFNLFFNSILTYQSCISYLNLQVDLHIPNPLRCLQCQTPGHQKSNSKHPPVCAKWGNPDHSSEDCRVDACCVNRRGT